MADLFFEEIGCLAHQNPIATSLFVDIYQGIRGFAAKDFFGVRSFCTRERAYKMNAHQTLFPGVATC